jgi:hypothetical protein
MNGRLSFIKIHLLIFPLIIGYSSDEYDLERILSLTLLVAGLLSKKKYGKKNMESGNPLLFF